MKERREKVRIGGSDIFDLVGVDGVDVREESVLVYEKHAPLDRDVEIHLQIDDQVDENADEVELEQDTNDIQGRKEEFEFFGNKEHVDDIYRNNHEEYHKVRLKLVKAARERSISTT